jgi:DNA-binding beta-propeller fold protein YncE
MIYIEERYMTDIIKNTIYYISNLKDSTITVIDSDKNCIMQTIRVGHRPFSIAEDNKSIYVASAGDDTVTVINNMEGNLRTFNIPNNGSIQVDSLNERIYVSNTSEILIYDMYTKEKIANIIGFISADNIKLNNSKNKLFVLDLLLNELKIFSTLKFNLITCIKNVGIRPNYMLINEKDEIVYIANQGDGTDENPGSISVVNIETCKIDNISFTKGSVITALELKENILYAVNKGLNRIELINTITNSSCGFILTTLPEPQRLIFTSDKNKLLVTDRNSGGQGGLDIIDTSSNSISNTIPMEIFNSQPYDVIAVNKILPVLNEEVIYLTDLQEKDINQNMCKLEDSKELVPAIVKKIFSRCEQKLIFPQVLANISEFNNYQYTFQKISFGNGFILKETENRTLIKNKPNYLRIQFTLRIPYTINFIDNKDNVGTIKDFLEENKDLILFIPRVHDEDEFKIVVKTRSKLLNSPNLIKNSFIFAVGVIMEAMVVGEVELLIPNFKDFSYPLRVNMKNDM